MATEKWIAGSGVGFTWSSAFGAEINAAIANGNAIASSVVIANQSSLDIFADLSWFSGAGVTTVAPAFLAFYLYPLNNNAVYGDGRFAASAAGPPPGNYYIGSIGFAAAAATTINGAVTGIIMPPGSFKFVVYNQAGVALATTNTCQYRTYNRSVA
jgi:hypothetical protein